MVHLQPDYCRSPVCCDPLNFELALCRPLKMIFPHLCPRVEEGNCLPRHWIFSIDVCPFAAVAMWTCQRHVGQSRLSTL
jgi:hypothetical protein